MSDRRYDLLSPRPEGVRVLYEALKKLKLANDRTKLDDPSVSVLTRCLIAAIPDAILRMIAERTTLRDALSLACACRWTRDSVAFLCRTRIDAPALTLNLCGIVEDFLLIVWSVLVSHALVKIRSSTSRWALQGTRITSIRRPRAPQRRLQSTACC